METLPVKRPPSQEHHNGPVAPMEVIRIPHRRIRQLCRQLVVLFLPNPQPNPNASLRRPALPLEQPKHRYVRRISLPESH